MDSITIFEALKEYGLLALAAAAAIAVLLSIAYLIYRKAFHGTKTFTKRQWITAILILGWFTVVLGLTTLSRGANYTGKINFALFSGYKNAWNEWSLVEYQLIIFNMLMFSPLGFLLPFIGKKSGKLSVACLVSFLVTLFIEVLQLITGRGIFELDDIVHNFVGSMFGYFSAAFLLDVMRNKKLGIRPLLRMLAIPIFFVLLTETAVIVYNTQPYGNLPFISAEKQDMSVLTVKNQLHLSDGTQSVPIFKNVYANVYTRAKEISESFAEFAGISFKKTVRTEGSNKIFQSAAGDEQLTAFMENGSWSYTSWREAVPVPQEQIASLRTSIEAWLSENGLLPETAVFTLQGGSILRWDIDMLPMEQQAADFMAGTVMVEIDADGNIATFHCSMVKYEYAGILGVVSASEAYKQIMDGNFKQYSPLKNGDFLTLTGE